MTKPAKFRVNMAEFVAQAVQFENDLLDFDNHRQRNAQVTRAVLAH
jgi:hypothetical protein